MRRHIAARTDNTPEAAQQRAALRKALELKNYEFNAHGVELGQRYASTAVVSGRNAGAGVHPRPRALLPPDDVARRALPHVWLGRDGRRISTHDLAGQGAVLPAHRHRGGALGGGGGEGGRQDLGIELAAYVIGPGREYIDLYEDWARAREVDEDGCVLVRPDAHVAWRSTGLVEDPAADLHRVLSLVLSRDGNDVRSGHGG